MCVPSGIEQRAHFIAGGVLFTRLAHRDRRHRDEGVRRQFVLGFEVAAQSAADHRQHDVVDGDAWNALADGFHVIEIEGRRFDALVGGNNAVEAGARDLRAEEFDVPARQAGGKLERPGAMRRATSSAWKGLATLFQLARARSSTTPGRRPGDHGVSGSTGLGGRVERVQGFLDIDAGGAVDRAMMDLRDDRVGAGGTFGMLSSPSMTVNSQSGFDMSSARACSRATWMQSWRQSPGLGRAMWRT